MVHTTSAKTCERQVRLHRNVQLCVGTVAGHLIHVHLMRWTDWLSVLPYMTHPHHGSQNRLRARDVRYAHYDGTQPTHLMLGWNRALFPRSWLVANSAVIDKRQA